MEKDTPTGFQGLVLEIVRGQQAQLDKLLAEIHGNGRPGLRELVVESRERLKNLEATLTKLQDGQEALESAVKANAETQRGTAARVDIAEKADHQDREQTKARVNWIAELVRAALLIGAAKLLDVFTPT